MTRSEQAAVAAKWWRDRLGERAKLDNGDSSSTGGMTFMLATMTQPELPSADRLDAFEAALKSALESDARQWVNVSCDYGPDMVLSGAADAAGIEARSPPFPWKTNMTLTPEGEVTVSHGYGAEPVSLPALEEA